MSRNRSKKSVTLLELIFAVVLILVIILGFASIDLFSRRQAISAERRVQLQNEASFTLEHMGKEIVRAIGNVPVEGIQNIIDTNTQIAGDTAVIVFIDANLNGRRDDSPYDHKIAYRLRSPTAAAGEANQIWFYPDFIDANDPHEVISRRISVFTVTVEDNFANIEVSARWNPSQDISSNNPEVTMRTRTKMPSVSTN